MMNRQPAILAWCASLLAGGFGLAGCERPATQPATEAASPAPSGSAAQQTADEAITARVKARLAADSELLPLPITVETKDGRVTLRGAVPPALIARAAQLVESVEGVRGVDNRLEPAGGLG